jgi:hypothetical protein
MNLSSDKACHPSPSTAKGRCKQSRISRNVVGVHLHVVRIASYYRMAVRQRQLLESGRMLDTRCRTITAKGICDAGIEQTSLASLCSVIAHQIIVWRTSTCSYFSSGLDEPRQPKRHVSPPSPTPLYREMFLERLYPLLTSTCNATA